MMEILILLTIIGFWIFYTLISPPKHINHELEKCFFATFVGPHVPADIWLKRTDPKEWRRQNLSKMRKNRKMQRR